MALKTITITGLSIVLFRGYLSPLNKTIESPVMVIVFRAIFYENNTYYPQDQCLYKI